MPINKYPGDCRVCGARILAGAGERVLTDAGWRVQCSGPWGGRAMITTRAAVVRHPEGNLLVRLVERGPAGRPSSFAILIDTDRATAMVPSRQTNLTGALQIFDQVVAAARVLCQPGEALMTVIELIAALQTMPQTAEIFVDGYENGLDVAQAPKVIRAIRRDRHSSYEGSHEEADEGNIVGVLIGRTSD